MQRIAMLVTMLLVLCLQVLGGYAEEKAKEEVQLSYAEKAAAAKVLLEQYDADGNGALNFEELQSMAGQNNLDRPGGLDEKQFTAKFDTRITREGKYQTKDVFTELDTDRNGFVSRLEMGGVKAFLTPQDL